MRRSLALAALLTLCACPGSSTRRLKGVGEACASRAECQSGLCFAHVCAASLAAAATCPAPPGTPNIAADPNPVNAVDPGPTFCVSTARDPTPSMPADMVQYLGTLQVGTDASFAATTDTASFVIFSQRDGTNGADLISITGFGLIPNVVVPTNVVAPGGTLYYDDSAGFPEITLGGLHYPNFTGLLGYDLAAGSTSSGFQFPNTSAGVDRVFSAGGVTAGDWSFQVNDWAWQCPFTDASGNPICSSGDASGRYGVYAVTRSGPITSTGTLDLEVYLVTDPSSDVSTAAAAAVHPQMQRWAQSVGAYLANAGLCLANVTFHDLPQWAKDRYALNGTVDVSTSDTCSDLDQLFTTAVVPSRAVHVFLADQIVAPTQGTFRIAGVDGSIPGPSGFPGTISGGAIVGLEDFSFGSCSGGPPNLSTCGADRVAYITAHEIGHWLGLYHTTESDGTLFDPVSDTAPCPCHLCAAAAQRAQCAEVYGGANPTSITNRYCTASSSCGGGRNLMFWLVDPAYSTGELSPDQGRIVRLNPAVR